MSAQLLTLIEAAARHDTTARALQRAAHRGSLNATKRGRDWFVTEEEVARYLRDRQHEGRWKQKKEQGTP